ncbi:hypothetical protein PG997_005496 [Apiospora hydei]|uniref:Malonyl-CoA:ACP transacylase (MAT) domain-containing protein n=1 Tax=Apiospora hydei TaxID=1337664 RepID=A0ABR1WL36_9PEZI
MLGVENRTRTAHRKWPFLLTSSAHDKMSLRASIEEHARVVDRYALLDLSYTLGYRRMAHVSKAFAVSMHRSIHETFVQVESGFSFVERKRGPPTVGFVFTGRGFQWPHMGAELIEYSYRFLDSIRALDRALDELHDGPDWSIEDVLLEQKDSSSFHKAEYSHPLCIAVQIALVNLLADWGIRPAVIVG